MAPSWVASVAVIVALGVPVITQVVPGTGTVIAIVVSIILGVLLGLSVLAHELGHCLAARLLGMRVFGVRLYLLGGVSEMARAPRSPREEAVIASAGPAVSALLAGVFWVALQAVEQGTVGWLLVLLLALSNLVVAVFNLLPALPLDGGRVLRAGVWRASGNRAAGTTAAVIGGFVIAIALAGWAVLMVIDAGTAGLLPAGIAVAMGLFVAVGAGAERTGQVETVWPADVSVQSLARPVAQLPTETPVAQALDAAADRAVILTEADGVARGMLDVAAARELASGTPGPPRRWWPGPGCRRRSCSPMTTRRKSPSGPVLSTPPPSCWSTVRDSRQACCGGKTSSRCSPGVAPTGGSEPAGQHPVRPNPERDLGESRLRRGRSGAADRLQGPQIHRRTRGGGDLPHPPRRPVARRPDRSAGGQPGHIRGRHVLSGAPAAADRLRPVHAARGCGDLPQGCGADCALG